MNGAGLPPSFRFDAAKGVLALDPRDSAFFRDPYPAYAEMHRLGGVFRWSEFGCVAVASHGLVTALLRDRRFGRISPGHRDGRPDYSGKPEHLARFYEIEAHSLLDLEPPTHTRLRSLVQRAFVSRRIAPLAPRIDALAHGLIDRFAADGRADLVEAFAARLPVTVIAELLGIEASDTAALLEWSHAMVGMYQFGRNEAAERRADRAAADFRTFVTHLIAAKRRAPGDDLVSGLIEAEADGGRLSEAEMVSTVILLMNAGHEATVHQIGNAAKAILESGLDVARLWSGEEDGGRLVEEVLRFDTPLHLFKRIAEEDVSLDGRMHLKRGDEVALLLGAANHDPRVFADPGRLDPARGDTNHLAFGGGIHFCIGAPLARLELRIALRALFGRLPGLTLAEPPRYRDIFHFRGLESLSVRFEPQRPSGSGPQVLTT